MLADNIPTQKVNGVRGQTPLSRMAAIEPATLESPNHYLSLRLSLKSNFKMEPHLGSTYNKSGNLTSVHMDARVY